MVRPLSRPHAVDDDRASGVLTDAGKPEEWPELIALPGTRLPVPFPTGVLGDPAAQYAEAVAAAHSTPVDLPATAILGTVSALVAGAIVIEPHAGWREPVNVYLMTLAAPGEGKSPVMGEVLHSLRTVESERAATMAPLIAEAESRRRILEAARDDAERGAAKAAAAKAQLGETQTVDEKVIALVREAAAIEVPAVPRLYTTEATPEALVRLLADQGGRMAVISDEGAEWYEMASRYSANGGSNFGIYLAGTDGTRYVSDRAGRGVRIIERTILTVCLVAQPVVLNDLGRDRKARGRGLLARVLWSRPTSRVGYRPTEPSPVPESQRASWDLLVKSLANESLKVDPTSDPPVLRLDMDALQIWQTMRSDHEPKLRPDIGALASITDWANKLPGQILRLAGLLHALRTGQLAGRIDGETMAAAVRLGAYYTDHALAVFSEMGTDEATQDAALVLRWLKNRALDKTSTRDVSQSKDWDSNRVRDALDVLVRHGYVRILPPNGNPGRPSERYAVNPRIHPSKPPLISVTGGFEPVLVDTNAATDFARPSSPPALDAREAVNAPPATRTPLPVVASPPRALHRSSHLCPDCRGSGTVLAGNGVPIRCLHPNIAS